MKENKNIALICFLVGIAIVLLINSNLFMTIAKDLSQKVQIYEKKGCYILNKK